MGEALRKAIAYRKAQRHDATHFPEACFGESRCRRNTTTRVERESKIIIPLRKTELPIANSNVMNKSYQRSNTYPVVMESSVAIGHELKNAMDKIDEPVPVEIMVAKEVDIPDKTKRRDSLLAKTADVFRNKNIDSAKKETQNIILPKNQQGDAILWSMKGSRRKNITAPQVPKKITTCEKLTDSQLPKLISTGEKRVRFASQAMTRHCNPKSDIDKKHMFYTIEERREQKQRVKKDAKILQFVTKMPNSFGSKEITKDWTPRGIEQFAAKDQYAELMREQEEAIQQILQAQRDQPNEPEELAFLYSMLTVKAVKRALLFGKKDEQDVKGEMQASLRLHNSRQDPKSNGCTNENNSRRRHSGNPSERRQSNRDGLPSQIHRQGRRSSMPNGSYASQSHRRNSGQSQGYRRNSASDSSQSDRRSASYRRNS